MIIATPKFRMRRSTFRVDGVGHIEVPTAPRRVWEAIQGAKG